MCRQASAIISKLNRRYPLAAALGTSILLYADVADIEVFDKQLDKTSGEKRLRALAAAATKWAGVAKQARLKRDYTVATHAEATAYIYEVRALVKSGVKVKGDPAWNKVITTYRETLAA